MLDREFELKEPVDVETLWHRLALLLPAMVRLYVPDAHRDQPAIAEELASTPLPELCGPTQNPDYKSNTSNISSTSTSYKCSELGLYGTLTLTTYTGGDYVGQQTISLMLLQSTLGAGVGLIVLTMSEVGRPIANAICYSCAFDMIEPVRALLEGWSLLRVRAASRACPND